MACSSRLPRVCWRALLVWLACIALPASAVAQTAGAVLGLRAEPGQEDTAHELTDALRRQAGQSEVWSLSETSASLDQMTMAHDCDASMPECLDKIAVALGVDQVVVGEVASGAEGAPRANVRLYVRQDSEVSATGSADLAEGAAMDDVALDLLRQLGIAAAPEADHETEPAPLTPVAAPVAAEGSEPVPYEDNTPASLDWLGYLLVGVAIASVGGAVFSWVQIDQASNNDDFQEYREIIGQQTPTTEDVCTQADDNYRPPDFTGSLAEVKDQCGIGSTFEVLQYVFLGTAAVTGGIGAYLLLTSDGGDASASAGTTLAVRPRVGRDGAGLSATLRF